MKLLKLTLENFKGLRNFSLEANGEDADVFGDNGTGKTSVADSESWLLFGKDSQGRAQFDLKTLDEKGMPVSNLNHSVEGTFDLDGETITLKKVYYEKYTKKRGDTVASFTGHETDYYIDSVPKQKGQYQKKVAELVADEKKFQLLTSPSYFPHMKWQGQRQLLLEVCGDITDADVIASNDELAELPAAMGKKSIEDFRDMVQNQKREVNKKLKSVPDRIDEATRAIPELPVNDTKPVINKLKTLHAKLEKKNDEISNLKNGGGVAQKRLELTQVDGEIAAAKNKFLADNSNGEALREKRSEVEKLNNIFAQVKTEIAELDRQAEQYQQEIARCKEEMANLLQEWQDERGRLFDGKEKCPTCAQDLPEDQVDKAKATFRANKAEKLADIESRGAKCKNRKGKAEAAVKGITEKMPEKKEKLESLTKQIVDLNAEIETATNNTPSFDDTDEYKKLAERKAKIEKGIATLKQGSDEAIKQAESARDDIKAEIKENDNIISAFDRAQTQRDRIAELKAEEKTQSAEYERLEGHLFLVEEFIKAKVSLLEEKINDRFELVKFKLFSTQINEGVKETCECTINGVPYSSLNSAGRVHAGMDIIKTLSKYYGFYPPIIIDQCESVTSLPEMDAQVIRLVVSEPDKDLRVKTKAVAEAA